MVIIPIEVVQDAGSLQLLQGHLGHDLGNLLQGAGAAGEGDEGVAQLDHFRLAPGHVLRDDEPGQTVVLIACVHEKLRLHTGDLAAGFQNAPGQAAHKTGFGPAVDQGVAAGPDPPAQLTDGALQRRVIAPAGAKINGDVHVHDSLRFSSLTIPGFAGKVQGNACQKGFLTSSAPPDWPEGLSLVMACYSP